MFRKGIMFYVLLVSLIVLSGCATLRRQKDLETQGLRNQISVLEAQLQAKDEELGSLRDALNKAAQEQELAMKAALKKRVAPEVKSRPSTKQIQIALKNAGYNPGPVDGRMGRQTRDAIRAFQRANGLAVDGRVGRQTWGLLRDYLDKKVK